MSDPTPPSSGPAPLFCGECGAVMPEDARFCGSCGAAPTAPVGGDDSTATIPAADTGGASTWQGVAPVVARDPELPTAPPGPPPASAPTVATAAVGGPPPGPPAGGPPGGPPPGGPPAEAKGKSKGPLILVVLLVLAALIGGALVVLGGDDGDGDDGGFSRDDSAAGADDEETTTTEADEETTTTEAADEETTTTAAGADITFVTVQDATGQLVVQVPDFWVTDGTTAGDGSPQLQAAPDLEAFRSLVSSGLGYTRFAVTRDADQVLDELSLGFSLDAACEAVHDRDDYDDGVFVGRSQIFENCGTAQLTLFEIVGTRSDGATVHVGVALLPDEPLEIVEQIQQTFNLTS